MQASGLARRPFHSTDRERCCNVGWLTVFLAPVVKQRTICLVGGLMGTSKKEGRRKARVMTRNGNKTAGCL